MLYLIIRTLNNLGKKHFENFVGKGENAGNQHFVLFPEYILQASQNKFEFLAKFNSSFASAFNFDWLKNSLFGKELRLLLPKHGSSIQDCYSTILPKHGSSIYKTDIAQFYQNVAQVCKTVTAQLY